MNEVRISKVARYDKDFTPAQRFEPDADTLALYHFDEGSGDELKDSSGNGHHGKIVGAKWVKAEGTPIAPAAPPKYALRYDGKTSEVQVPSLLLPEQGPLCIEAFVTVTSDAPFDFKTYRVIGSGQVNIAIQRESKEIAVHMATAAGVREAKYSLPPLGKRFHECDFGLDPMGCGLLIFLDSDPSFVGEFSLNSLTGP